MGSLSAPGSAPLTSDEQRWVQDASEVFQQREVTSDQIRDLGKRATKTPGFSNHAIKALLQNVKETQNKIAIICLIPTIDVIDEEIVRLFNQYLEEYRPLSSAISEKDIQAIVTKIMDSRYAHHLYPENFNRLRLKDQDFINDLVLKIVRVNNYRSIVFFKEFGLTNQEFIKKVVLELAGSVPKECIEKFANFGLTNQLYIKDIAIEWLQRDPYHTVGLFHKFGLREKAYVKEFILKLVKLYPDLCVSNFSVFELWDQEDQDFIQEIAAVIAQVNPENCAKHFGNFRLKDPTFIRNLVMNMAKTSPRICISHFPSFGFKITDADQAFIRNVALEVAKRDPKACAKHFKKLGLVNQDFIKEMALVLAKEDPAVFPAALKNFGFKNRKTVEELVLRIAEENPGFCAEHIQEMLPDAVIKKDQYQPVVYVSHEEHQKFLNQVAMIIAEKDPRSFVSHLQNFEFSDYNEIREHLLRIAKDDPVFFGGYLNEFYRSESLLKELILIVAEGAPLICIRKFFYFHTLDEEFKKQIALKIAEFHPETCASLFHYLGLKNPAFCKEVVMKIAEKNPQACIDNFHLFHLTDQDAIESILKLVESVPAACMEHFANFNLSDQTLIKALILKLAKKDPKSFIQHIENFDIKEIKDTEFLSGLILFLAEKEPALCAEHFAVFALEDKNIRKNAALKIARADPIAFLRYYEKFWFENTSDVEEVAEVLMQKDPIRFLNVDLKRLTIGVNFRQKQLGDDLIKKIILKTMQYLSLHPELPFSLEFMDRYMPAALPSLQEVSDLLDQDSPFVLAFREKLEELLIKVDPLALDVPPLELPPLEDSGLTVPQVREGMLRLLNLLVTDDPTSDFYVHPDDITDDGVKITREGLTATMETLFTNIETRAQAEAISEDAVVKERQYQDLEMIYGNIYQMLQDLIDIHEDGSITFKPERDKSEFALKKLKFIQILLRIGVCANHCATRWREEGIRSVRELRGEPEGTPRQMVHREIANFFLSVVEAMFLPNFVHDFGNFMKDYGSQLRIPGHELATETLESAGVYLDPLEEFLMRSSVRKIEEHLGRSFRSSPVFRENFEPLLAPYVAATESKAVQGIQGRYLGENWNKIVERWYMVLSSETLTEAKSEKTLWIDELAALDPKELPKGDLEEGVLLQAVESRISGRYEVDIVPEFIVDRAKNLRLKSSFEQYRKEPNEKNRKEFEAACKACQRMENNPLYKKIYDRLAKIDLSLLPRQVLDKIQEEKYEECMEDLLLGITERGRGVDFLARLAKTPTPLEKSLKEYKNNPTEENLEQFHQQCEAYKQEHPESADLVEDLMKVDPDVLSKDDNPLAAVRKHWRERFPGGHPKQNEIHIFAAGLKGTPVYTALEEYRRDPTEGNKQKFLAACKAYRDAEVVMSELVDHIVKTSNQFRDEEGEVALPLSQIKNCFTELQAKRKKGDLSRKDVEDKLHGLLRQGTIQGYLPGFFDRAEKNPALLYTPIRRFLEADGILYRNVA